MRISKDLATDFGVPATTWRIESVVYRPRSGEIYVDVVGFAGSGGGLRGETPIASRSGNLAPEKVAELMTAFAGVEGAVFAAFAASHPDFSGAAVEEDDEP